MLLLALIVFSVTTVYSTSRISAPDFQAVNFAQAKEMRKLNGSVIKQIHVMSEDECSHQCVRDERCLSYNFGNTKNKSGTFVCELSDSDRFLGFGNFTEDVNFTYRGMQVTIAEMTDAVLSLIRKIPLVKETKPHSYATSTLFSTFLFLKIWPPRNKKELKVKRKKISKAQFFFCGNFIEWAP